jgi:hypothetical protein
MTDCAAMGFLSHASDLNRVDSRSETSCKTI